MTDFLLACILAVLIINMIISSSWWLRAKTNTPYVVKNKAAAIKRRVKRG